MKADTSCEQRFIAEVDAFEFLEQDLKSVLRRLNDWLAQFSTDLEANRLTGSEVSENSALARQIKAIDAMLHTAMSTWSRQWNDLQPALALADSFDDKAILLVFGKFNAGKSSFCNLLADRFSAQGKIVRYFHLDAGRIVETPERLREGVTETTARLQGVFLGERLMLLDTPGLHSVTPENAALTQHFTDSADGVLWLTSSASPGQVQELDELARELRRAKPLLPVVTRSDLYEEDEVDGQLVKRLRNKTAENRALQEADVVSRAREKLAAVGVNVTQLRPPVSISVYMAREPRQMPAAMEEAGFERLYAALRAIAEPALAYKRRKPAEVLLHHLEENVMGTLHDRLLPALAELKEAERAARGRLVQHHDTIIEAAWREVVPALAELLESHAAARDVKAVCRELSRSLFGAFLQAEREYLGDYTVCSDEARAEIELATDISFEAVAVEAGGLCEVVGVDYARLYAELEKQVRARLLALTGAAMDQCQRSLAGQIQSVTCKESILRDYERRLLEVKAELRADMA